MNWNSEHDLLEAIKYAERAWHNTTSTDMRRYWGRAIRRYKDKLIALKASEREHAS